MAMEIGTREKILTAASEEFSARGLEGARVDRIAALAGINKAMIYYHFRSKKELYRSVIESHIEMIGRFWEGAVASENDVEQIALKAAQYYNSLSVLAPGFRSMLLREIAGGGDVFRNALFKTLGEKKVIENMRQMIEKGIAAGQFRSVDSKQAMLSFLGMNLFYMLMAPLMNEIWEIVDVDKFRQERPHEIVELYFYGLKKR